MPWFFTTRIAVVSSGASAPSARSGRRKPVAPANATPPRKRRRVCIIAIGNLPSRWRSRLQLAFELVQEPPIRPIGDDLLRAGLDHPGFVQAQRVEPESVLVIVLAPFVVRDLVERLQRVIIARGETAIDEPSCGPRRLGDAEVGGFEDGA